MLRIRILSFGTTVYSHTKLLTTGGETMSSSKLLHGLAENAQKSMRFPKDLDQAAGGFRGSIHPSGECTYATRLDEVG